MVRVSGHFLVPVYMVFSRDEFITVLSIRMKCHHRVACIKKVIITSKFTRRL